MSIKNKNVLVISVHPDDEALGCAGTLFKHKDAGDNLYWAIITNVTEGHGYSSDVVNRRNNEIQEVSHILGIKSLMNLQLKPAGLDQDSIPQIIGGLGKFINENKIDIIYCVNRSDAHSDHRISFEACSAFIKSFRYPTVQSFYMYECLSETEFAPSLHEKIFIPQKYVNISDQYERKLQILNVYKSELGIHPFPRSLETIEALAKLRGSFAGCRYAEAFQVIKDVWLN